MPVLDKLVLRLPLVFRLSVIRDDLEFLVFARYAFILIVLNFQRPNSSYLAYHNSMVMTIMSYHVFATVPNLTHCRTRQACSVAAIMTVML